MKAVVVSLAVLAAVSTAALADGDAVKTIQGCEVKQVENGNYYNLVDATCSFSGAQDNDTGAFRLADFDRDPATPDTFGYIER